MQVKDLTKNENEKVFIFNGWTFLQTQTLPPLTMQFMTYNLLNCYKI